MATKTIKQTRTFTASAKDLYEAIMDSRKHSRFTGAPAKISAKVGGAFSVHGGYATGRNLELKPNKEIIQSWHASDWPADHYSMVTFAFSPAGKGKTKLTFTHAGVPEDQIADIKQGWIDYYWTPLKKMFE